MVIATGSSFINNQRSADFYNYNFDTPSEFFDCEFIVNDDYRRNTNFIKDYFDAHITMSMANGLVIRESNFSNEYSTPQYISKVAKLGDGIRTSDGGFEVQSSSFSGFEHAIYAGNTCNLETFNVNTGCTFEKNLIGVRVDGVNNFKVIESTFDVGEANVSAAPDVPYYQFGIVNLTGSGFLVEENSFTGIPDPTFNTTYGIWMENTNEIITESNDVYRNNFDAIEFSNFATGINKSDEGIGVGLEYNCNNNNTDNSFYDFAVVGKGVSEFQGGFTSGGSESAGNSFTNTTNSNFFHFFNGGEPFTYFFSSIDPNPSTLNFTQNSIATAIDAEPHQCDPTLLTNPNDPNEVKFTKNKLSFDSLNNVLDQLIDGGSSSDMISQISETSTAKADFLKNNLLQNSPYLSNEAIKIFANRTDIYSNQDIYDVIVQNPEETRRLGTFLLEKEIPFTDAMMGNLTTATLGVSSVRGQQEAEQHLYYKEMMTAANAILFDLKANSPTENFAKVNQWIIDKENQLPFYGLIELQIREGNYTVAQSMINTVPLDYDLSIAQQLDYDNFVLLKSYQMDVYGNGETWAALSAEQEDDLVTIADSNEGWTGKQSRHILNHYFGYHYPLSPPSVVNDDAPDSPYISQFNNQFNSSKQLVTATPNPASEDVFFDFRDLDYQVNNQLHIKDINGNVIKTFTLEGDNGNVQWSTNNLPSGIYIYYIEIDGKVKAIQKLVLIK